VTAQATPDDQVRVSKIFPDSSAARSALAVEDILLALNGTAIRSVDGFLAGVRSSKSGDRLIYHVRRDGKEMDVEVVLAELPREQPNDI
jgi:S1-C subfamily serine protease